MNRLLPAMLLGVLVFANVEAQQPAEGPLTNATVVKLVKAGFKDKTVITIISNRPTAFKLDPEQLIQLKRQGVSENVILTMMSVQDAGFVSDDETWAIDPFSTKKSKDGSAQRSGGDIFGSGSSSRSSTRDGMGKGGDENEGTVTGSATVRILKPVVTTPATLEKAPALNNEAVIRLVEAGFSEGTIIKRIENSPASFDLSPAKLDELHKRRVTDPIIAAMTAAMGGDTKP